MSKALLNLICLIIFTSSCVYKEDIKIKVSDKVLNARKSINVSNIQFANQQFTLSGSHLDKVTQVRIKNGNTIETLEIASQNSHALIAKALANTVLPVGIVLDLIVTTANASSTYTFNFSLCDALLGGRGFDCNVSPNDKEVLSFDAASGRWKPRAINGLSYKGTWDASTPFPEADESGEYFIVSDADGIYQVGDWIVYNGSTFNKIDNSQAIVSVFGRTGAITANLNDLSDLEINNATTGQVLKYDGGKWINEDSNFTESDPSVRSFAKTGLPICATGEVLKSDGTQFSCVSDSTGAGAFSGTADRIVITNSSGGLQTSSVSSTLLSNLIPWQDPGVQTIDPSRLSLGVSQASKALVTDSSGLVSVSNVSGSELGYLQGVTSNLQSQLNSKIATETDPNVVNFAKEALPNCGADEVLKGNGTSLACVSVNIGKVTTNQREAGAIHPFGTSSGQTGEFRFYELAANGTEYTGFKAPDQIGANLIYTLPQTAPTSGQVLSSTASGVLSWIDSGSAPVTSVNSKTGVVSLSTSDISEGTNLYFTNARVLSTQITSPTLTNSAIATNDSIQTSFGKLQAQINNKESQITAGTTAQYLRGDKVWSNFASDTLGILLNGLSTASTAVITTGDSILTALGKLQGQSSSKADRTNLTQIISAQTVTGLQNPTANSDAANKAYVDSFAGTWSIAGTDIYRSSGKVGIGTTTPAYPLSVNGVIESSLGGIRFPDGSTQITAATTSALWSTNAVSSNATYKMVAATPQGQLGTQTTVPTSGSVDDGFYTFNLPFAVDFNGVSYSTIYIGTNSYATFGGGANSYSGLGVGNPAYNKIMIAAADRSSNSVWFESTPTSFKIRYEGGCGTSPSASQIWELRADSSNSKKIIVNVIAVCAGGYSVVATPSASLYSINPVAGNAYEIETLANPISTDSINYLGGNVGIGTSTPGVKTKLKVEGQIVGKSAAIDIGAIDFSLGNTITTANSCSSNIVLENIRDGGDYKVIVTNGGTTQCTFDTATQGDDSGTVTYRYSPANAARTSSSHTIYRLTRAGNIVYVSWTTGFN